MITLKVWNSLSQRKRKEISRIVFNHMGSDFVEEMSQPFRHNFEYEGGHWYKLLLDHCTLAKDKRTIKISFIIGVD